MDRISKDQYYLDIAKTVCKRSTCLRKQYGAIIVKNDEIIATGYNGAPRGRKNCCEIGKCLREEFDIPSGQRYELCRSVHAESNAIISASRKDMIGASLYLYGERHVEHAIASSEIVTDFYPDCCSMCKRLVLNAGIKELVRYHDDEIEHFDVSQWIENDDSLPERARELL